MSKCSSCRDREWYVKFKGSVLCVPCLVKCAQAGIHGAEELLERIHRRAAKRRALQQEAR